MGHTQKEIAKVIGVHRSTIFREIRRNSGKRGYRPPAPETIIQTAQVPQFVLT